MAQLGPYVAMWEQPSQGLMQLCRLSHSYAAESGSGWLVIPTQLQEASPSHGCIGPQPLKVGLALAGLAPHAGSGPQTGSSQQMDLTLLT